MYPATPRRGKLLHFRVVELVTKYREPRMPSFLTTLTLIALTLLGSRAALAAPSLDTPATAAAGSTITFKATGSGNPREFVTVVPKGTREGAYEGYVYVGGGGSLKLAMPAQPGEVGRA